MRALLLGGLLPVLIFTFVEEFYGTQAGLFAGLVFGAGEILYEFKTYGKVELATWLGNGLLFFLGGLSLLSQDGIWYKLQPALMEFGFALFIGGSSLMDRPIFYEMMLKQMRATGKQPNPEVLEVMQKSMKGMSLRGALFFILHGVLTTWAALRFSTGVWAAIKGVGFTVTFLLWALIEALWMRKKIKSHLAASAAHSAKLA